MAPIRLGILGLSKSGGWASNAHLPYLNSSSKFTITALCNSTKEAAEAAKEHYKLPESVKTYGSPDELAADENVDLVVCTVRVDRHKETIQPALKRGKACYVEWPLAANLKDAEELARLAKENGARTMIGLQGRRSSIVNKVKELVESSRIGKVLSSTIVSSAGNLGPSESAKLRYFLDKKIGGNIFTIHFSHLIDSVQYAIGDFSNVQALLSTQRPKVDLTDEGKVVETVTKDTYDQILVQGQLQNGAVFSVHQRGGGPFKEDSPRGVLWKIYGETGEIQLTADGSFIHMGGYPNMELKVHDFKSDKVEAVEWQDVIGPEKDLPGPARNVGRLYEAFADGKTDEYADFDDAVRRHKLLEEIQQSSDSGKRQASQQ